MAGRSLADVYVSVRADTSRVASDIDQGVRRVDTRGQGEKAGRAYGSAFSGGARRVIGALVAAAGIGNVIKESVQGFREHQQVVAQTNAVIRSTKGAAGISAKAMSDYSDALERNTKVDGDVILAGENMLATFTNVQNRAGKGNDIFNQSTRTLLDLAAATGTDAPKAAIQLGKALNDPVRGVTALTRVGVTFDAQQRKQIASMQEAGNIAGAQRIVLAELNKEFGGSAKAQGDALGAQGRLTVAWHQAQDTLGAALLPVVNEFEDALADRLPGAADKASEAIKTGQVAVSALIAAYRDGDVTSDGFIGKTEQIGVALGRVRDYLKGVDFHKFAGDTRDVGSSLASVDVEGFAQQLQSVDTSHFGDALNVFGRGLGFVADHIDLIVKAMPALLVAYGGYKAAEAAGNVAALASIPIRVAQVASNFALSRSLKALAAGQVEVAVATGGATASEAVKTAVIGAGTAATSRGTAATLASAVAQRAVAVASKAWAAAQWLVNAALTANPIGIVIVAVAALAAGIIYAYKHSETFRKIVTGMWSAIQAGARIAISGILTYVGLWLAGLGHVVSFMAKLPGPLGAPFKAAAKSIDVVRGKVFAMRDDMNRAIGGVKSRTVTVTAALRASQSAVIGVGTGGSGGRNQRLATGGPVRGPGTSTSDSILAWVSNDEHMLTAKDVRNFGGHDAVMQMRKAAARMPAYAAGGPVGLNISSRLFGMDRFEASLANFNTRVDAAARRLAIASATAGGATGRSPGAVGGNAALGRTLAAQMYGWTGGQWSALFNLWQGESGWNNNAQNPTSTAYGIAQFLNCVPLDTEILTRDGWKSHDSVRVGDETLGFNPDTDRLEWTPVLAKVLKPSEPVTELAVGNWRARTTPGHRWWSERRTTEPVDMMTVCPICGTEGGKRGKFASTRAVQTHAAKAHGVTRMPQPYHRVGEFVRSDSVTKAHRLRLAALAGDDGGGNDRITDDEAALLGWIVGDGTVNHASRTVNVWVFQAKKRFIPVIDALLVDVPHSRYVRDRSPGKHLPAVSWRLRSGYARSLLGRSGLLDRTPEEFVLALSAKQRGRWLEAIWQAEGWTVASGPDGEVRRISQNAGAWADAMTLAAYLEGYRPTRHLNARVNPKHSDNWTITFGRPWIGGTAIRRTELANEPVWCVQTGLGTWTMRQNGLPMLTGNSTWGGVGAVKTSDPGGQIRAGLRYIAQVYGTPSNAYGKWLSRSPHWYDGGGWLAPGVTMAVNGTGRPERVRTGRQEDALLSELRALRRDLARLPIAQVDEKYVRRSQRYMNGRDPSGW